MHPVPLTYSVATFAEIDLSAFKHNLIRLKQMAGSSELLAVIKTNAYGHGIVPIGHAAVEAGAERLGVSTMEDAIALRDSGITSPIQLLSAIAPDQAEVVVSYALIASVSTVEVARAISQEAEKMGQKAFVHLKVDTGLHRFGLEPDQAISFCKSCYTLPGLNWEGIYTHLSCADEGNWQTTEKQFHLFLDAVNDLARHGFYFPIRHTGASTITMERKDMHLDMVRPGISLFGYPPAERQRKWMGLKPVLSLKSNLLKIQELPPHTPIGYGGEYITQTTEKIAVVPIGIGDGYQRILSNRAKMLVRGKRARVVGAISLDQTFLNVTGIPDAEEGDEVVIIGKQEEDAILATEVAEWMDSIVDEVLAALMPRVPRYYV